MRTSGILLPITSLPSPHGIGTLGQAAYDFIDFLQQAGQTYWQILPLGPTGYGDSPYQAFSTFAGNPYLIDLDVLVEKHWLTPEEIEVYCYGEDPAEVDYGRLYGCRFKVLKTAFKRARPQLKEQPAYQAFLKENEDWLPDYALFRAVKDSYGGRFWQEWDIDIKLRRPEAVARYRALLAEDIAFYCFLEYEFFTQYAKLKAYAHAKGIQIFGDLPIYVSIDSADAWASPELFCFDEELSPTKVAGVPPDAFSETGQLWGNPLYNWPLHEQTGFAWWIRRVQHSLQLHDLIRIDHFRGFDEYYAIPYGEKTALRGAWEKGPGMALFAALRRALGGDLPIVAEDLGILTPGVYALLEQTGFPGMKVLQFAFDGGPDNEYLPYNQGRHSVVYTGTHDNDTLQGWRQAMAPELKEHIVDFLGLEDETRWNEALIRMALMSRCDTAIVPLQEYLELGSEARINEPSTLGTNWRWRLTPDWLEKRPELEEQMRHWAELYGRVH